MSLNWNLTKIKNHKERCYFVIKSGESKGKHAMCQETTDLIWSTIIIGMDIITEKNWKEFFLRLRIAEQVMGYKKERMNTPATVRDHIGLSTNATLYNSTKFYKHIKAIVERNHLIPFLKQEQDDAEVIERQDGTTG